MDLLPLLPLLVPLTGALLCLILRSRGVRVAIQRAAYVVSLLLTAGSLLAIRITGAIGAVTLAPRSYVDLPVGPLWTPLAFLTSSVLLAALLIGAATDHTGPRAQALPTACLFTLAVAMGLFSAGNVVSLALAWSVTPWLLLYVRVSQAGEAQHVSRWDVWAGFASTALVILGTMASATEHSGALYLLGVGPGLAFWCLAAAAALRLFRAPMSGEPGLCWELNALTLTTGLFLWLRAGLALEATAALTAHPALIVGIGLGLGLVIGPRSAVTPGLPRGYAYWLAIALLASLLDPIRGYAVSILVGMQLLLSMAVTHLGTTPEQPNLLSRIPGIIVSGALYGMVLTTGLMAQWVFGQICLQVGGLALLALAAVAFVISALPFWSTIESLNEQHAEPLAAMLTPGGHAASAGAAAIVVLGVWPGLIQQLWPQVRLGLGALRYSQLAANTTSDWWALALACVVLPLGASYGYAQQAWRSHRATGELTRAGAYGEWLYLLVQRLAAYLWGALRSLIETLEGPLLIPWCFLWCVALAFYLLQR